ncbi:hypothetical protein Bhyg_10562 [Pseudolycoriella hygida]|uniref:Shootin-1 n=1 Tax=Pseudolycoriella hygida TaxID=35572 RepID=A0A9Q0RZ49_9DIPT|nr:hypothetical protein Bhyg_10562 [Pseudolycoriella hygida]
MKGLSMKNVSNEKNGSQDIVTKMESPQRPSGIPISKGTSKLRFNKSFSKSNDCNLNGNYSDAELDTFHLLEENSSLKDEKQKLIDKLTEVLKKNNDISAQVSRLSGDLEKATAHQKTRDVQIQKIIEKLQNEVEEKQKLQRFIEQQNVVIKTLNETIRLHEVNQNYLLEASREAKTKLSGLLPGTNELEMHSNNTKKDILATQTLEQLVIDIGNIRTHLNTTELQLYEANEKISELIENQHQLEKENECLKTENVNLEQVAMLMTNGMKESVDTSKRMEEAIIQMKKRNDELVKENRDVLDSPGSPKFMPPNEQISQLREELSKKEIEHSERIVEMTRQMEATIENNFKDEIGMLNVKVAMLESQLKLANDRADKAESELADLKKSSIIKYHLDNGIPYRDNLISFPPTSKQITEAQETQKPIPKPPPPPPPPPPPAMQKFNLPHTNITKNGTSLNDSIAAFEFKMGNDNTHNQQVQATETFHSVNALIEKYSGKES